jgi:hypothetical protein
MNVVSIPEWTSDGVLPPVDALDLTSANRSPYRVDLTDVVRRFACSKERVEILDGLIRYRKKLHDAGLHEGFQWLDGSFAEDVESLHDRPPYDIDVVTFYALTEGTTQQVVADRHPELLDHSSIKKEYNVDGYLVSLDSPSSLLIRNSLYWYSVWSHRRDMAWKGYIEVDLNSKHDLQAARELRAAGADTGDEL